TMSDESMEGPMRVIDADQHLFEPRSMWRDFIDPGVREDALAIEDDELGYPWLTWRGKRLYLAELQTPGQAKPIGRMRQRLKNGLPAEHSYDEGLSPEYYDAGARLGVLDRFKLESAVMLPNFGLLWEDMLSSDIGALTANMRAFNRWMAAAVEQSQGRLHGVAHVSLRDERWVREELRSLERAGIKLAMVGPAPVDGRALSHPGLDPIWSVFEEHDVAAIFHVGGHAKPLHPAWYEQDPEPVDKVLDSAMLWVAPAVALGAMCVYGTFERHPRLRVGVIEMTAHWVPETLLMLEGALGFYVARHGEPPVPLPLTPSEYFRRHVRVGVLAYEQPERLIGLAGEDIYMFGSDWPHAEGLDDPVTVTLPLVEGLTDSGKQKLFAGNIDWLLGGVDISAAE
ncbi:MAG: amidohydrolase family protein, partial [Actinomycetota bacterium]